MRGRPRNDGLKQFQFGPRIPLVPVTDFSSMRMSNEQWAGAWRIVGPSVERNMTRGRELWVIITAAYLEGLSHGAAITEEKYNGGPLTDSGSRLHGAKRQPSRSREPEQDSGGDDFEASG